MYLRNGGAELDELGAPGKGSARGMNDPKSERKGAEAPEIRPRDLEGKER